MTGVQGPRPSFQPSIGGCLSRWPYSNTVSSDSPGTSIHNSGVRPSSRTTSSTNPGTACAWTHSATRSTARSMWPLAYQSGSKTGDWLGIVTYCRNAGTMRSVQALSISRRVAVVSIARSVLDAHRVAHRQVDGLRLQVGAQSFRAELAADAGAFEAAERSAELHHETVHRVGAGAHAPGDVEAAVDIGRPYRAGQPVVGVVGDA